MPQRLAEDRSRAIVLHPNGIVTLRALPIDEIERGQEIADIIGGMVQVIALDDSCSLFMDEEGKIKKLQANPTATLLAAGQLSRGDIITGTVILAGNPDLPKVWLEKFFS